MSLLGALFYLLALLILATTALAVTRRNLVHAIIYLILSFFGSAMLFYLLGAPLLAALEVIIYAGAIMILFLFIIMMLRVDTGGGRLFPPAQLWPAAVLAALYLAVGAVAAARDPAGARLLKTAVAAPREFGRYLFENHWLSIELVSLLLLVALVGALVMGRRPAAPGEDER